MKTCLSSGFAFVAAVYLLNPETLPAQLADGTPVLPPTSPLVAQVEEGPDVTVAFDSGKSATAHTLDRVAERVGLRPNEVVNITIQYGALSAGQTVTAVPLDGGRIIGNDNKLIVGSDGVLSFKFQAGKDAGVYEIQLRQGTAELGLQFWVFDEQHPERNPPVVPPSN